MSAPWLQSASFFVSGNNFHSIKISIVTNTVIVKMSEYIMIYMVSFLAFNKSNDLAKMPLDQPRHVWDLKPPPLVFF